MTENLQIRSRINMDITGNLQISRRINMDITENLQISSGINLEIAVNLQIIIIIIIDEGIIIKGGTCLINYLLQSMAFFILL